MTFGNPLSEHGLFIATAESLTAGLLSAELASNPGASRFLLGGIVCYQDQIKIQQLGVDAQLVSLHSAVNPEVARQMAEGVRAKFAADCAVEPERVIGISTTGVAGPDRVGDQPVGRVYLGIASAISSRSVALNLSGSRAEIRSATVLAALSEIQDEIQLLLG